MLLLTEAISARSGTHCVNKNVLRFRPVVPGWDFEFTDETQDPEGTPSPVASPPSIFSIPIDDDVLLFLQRCAAYRNRLQDDLAKVCAKVRGSEAGLIHVEPLAGADRVLDWQARASRAAENILRELTYQSVVVNEDAAPTVLMDTDLQAKLEEMKTMVFKPDVEARTFQLAGAKTSVSRAKQLIEKLVAEVEESLRNRVQDRVRVKPDVLLLLTKCSGIEDLKKRFRNTTVTPVTTGKNKGTIQLEGPQREVNQIGNELRRKGEEVMSIDVEFPSKALNQVMASVKGTEFAEAVIKEAGLEATISIRPAQGRQPPQIKLVGWVNNETELEGTKEKLRDLVSEEVIELRPQEVEALRNPKWHAAKMQVRDNFLVQILDPTEGARADCISFHGVVHDIRQSREIVRKFFDENAIVCQKSQLPAGMERYLVEYHKTSLHNLETKFKEFQVTVRIADNIATIRGTEHGVKLAAGEFEKVLKSEVAEGSIEITRPGMKRYFVKEEAGKQLRAIEKEKHVVIEQDRILSKSPPGELLARAGSLATNQLVVSALTKEGKKISIYRGDITRHKCDIMVNAANGKLDHIGGVAKAIATAGGPEIQVDCHKFVKQKGELLPSHVYVGKAGKLPCKRLVHVVGPSWSGGRSGESRYLQQGISNCLEEASQHNSIALPAISTGVYGFPGRMAAEIMINAVLDFSFENQASQLHDIHFVDQNDAMINTLRSVLEDVFQAERDKLFYPGLSSDSTNRRPKGRGGAGGGRGRGHGGQGRAQRGRGGFGGSTQTVTLGGGKIVTVKQGDLCKEKVSG